MHERSIESDFLIIILRDLLASTRPDLRLVLMSATVRDAFIAVRACHFTDIPSPSTLNHPLKGERGAAE